VQKEPAEDATDVPGIILTHRVREGEMDSAIGTIEALDSIIAPVTRIRVETLDAR
jgi:homoserine dehydrogenase